MSCHVIVTLNTKWECKQLISNVQFGLIAVEHVTKWLPNMQINNMSCNGLYRVWVIIVKEVGTFCMIHFDSIFLSMH
jgi:hypothetical protein